MDHVRPESPMQKFFDDLDDEELTELIDAALRERMIRAHYRSHGEAA